MAGPGRYVPDVTEGITRVQDLPPAKVVERSRNYRRRPCPNCGRNAYRLRAYSAITTYTPNSPDRAC